MAYFYPPLSLRDISPARGEIAGGNAFPISQVHSLKLRYSLIQESPSDFRSPPLRGRCSSGQRGVQQ